MAKQKVKVGTIGATAMRVLEALTPMTGVAAPAVNAEFIGQVFVDTVTPAVYVSVAVGSVAAANDWKKVSFAA